jgi:hypothetical protein
MSDNFMEEAAKLQARAEDAEYEARHWKFEYQQRSADWVKAKERIAELEKLLANYHKDSSCGCCGGDRRQRDAAVLRWVAGRLSRHGDPKHPVAMWIERRADEIERGEVEVK